MKKIITLALLLIIVCVALVGCGRAMVDTATDVAEDVSSGMNEAGDAMATDADGFLGENETTVSTDNDNMTSSENNTDNSMSTSSDSFM